MQDFQLAPKRHLTHIKTFVEKTKSNSDYLASRLLINKEQTFKPLNTITQHKSISSSYFLFLSHSHAFLARVIRTQVSSEKSNARPKVTFQKCKKSSSQNEAFYLLRTRARKMGLRLNCGLSRLIKNGIRESIVLPVFEKLTRCDQPNNTSCEDACG